MSNNPESTVFYPFDSKGEPRRETSREIYKGGGQAYSSWRSRNTYEFDDEGKARITKRQDYKDKHNITDETGPYDGTPIDAPEDPIDQLVPDGDEPRDSSLDGPIYEPTLGEISNSTPEDDADQVVAPHLSVEELIKEYKPLYERYMKAREEFVDAHAEARLADVGIKSVLGSAVDKIASKTSWAGRLKNKLSRHSDADAMDDQRQIAYDTLKKEYEDALDAALRSYSVRANKDLDSNDRTQLLLALEIEEKYRLDQAISEKMGESNKKNLLSRKVGAFVGAGSAALLGISSAMVENGKHHMTWLALGTAAGAVAGYAAAKASRFVDGSQTTASEEDAEKSIYLRHRNGSEVGKSLALEAVSDDTDAEHDREVNRLIGATTLGAAAAWMGHMGVEAFSGAIAPYSHRGGDKMSVGNHVGTTSHYSTPAADVQASPAAPIEHASPAASAVEQSTASHVLATPTAPHEATPVAATPAGEIIGPHGQTASLEAAGQASGAASSTHATVLNESGRIVNPSAVEVPEYIMDPPMAAVDTTVNVPEDITNPPRTVVGTTVRVPEDLPGTAGDVPVINPQEPLTPPEHLEMVGYQGGVNPSSPEYQMSKALSGAGSDLHSMLNAPAGDTTNAAKDMFGGIADQAHEIDSLKLTILPGDGFTDILQREYHLNDAQSRDLFDYLEGRFGTHGILAGVDTYPMSDGRPGIRNTGSTSFMPGVKDATVEWLNAHAVHRGV